MHLNKLEREEHLVAAFSYFDKDASGYITVDELQSACKEHNMTDVFIDDIIREVDQDNVSNVQPKRPTLYQSFSQATKLSNFFCSYNVTNNVLPVCCSGWSY